MGLIEAEHIQWARKAIGQNIFGPRRVQWASMNLCEPNGIGPTGLEK